jgi:methanogenic corrinoid protein MtbC1
MLYDSRDSADTLATDRDLRASEASPSAGAETGQRAGAGARGAGACARTAEILSALGTAAICPDRAEAERQLGALLDAGVDREALIDRHIPEVAREFGAAWGLNDRSFAEVTIAVARLQGWLRELDPARPSAPFDIDAPEILLVVAEGAQHTLGAMVAMSRFRRLGAHVRLSIGRDARALVEEVRGGHVDMVALSGAGTEDLDFLSRVAHLIKCGVANRPRIVLGGEVLNQVTDVAKQISADHATSDPQEALELCGFARPLSAAPLRTMSRPEARGQPERVPTGA